MKQEKSNVKSKVSNRGKCLITFIIFCLVIWIISLAEPEPVKIYEQTILDNATNVFEKIPNYTTTTDLCPYKEGILIEDRYSAEWYVKDSKIYTVNGIAKELTPNIEYAPNGISYQKCYKE